MRELIWQYPPDSVGPPTFLGRAEELEGVLKAVARLAESPSSSAPACLSPPRGPTRAILEVCDDAASLELKPQDVVVATCDGVTIEAINSAFGVPVTFFVDEDTLALVGLGAPIMDSSIWVAVTTGLAAMLAFSIIHFWAMKTFSGGISIPRSPLATMIPSDAAKISS